MNKFDNFKGKANSNGLDKNPQNILGKGQPISIKTQLKEILKANGELTIKTADVIKTKKNGDVVISVCTEMNIALRLTQLAMGKADATTIKAIQMLLETFDGKPRQVIDFEPKDIQPLMTIRLEPRKEQNN